MFQFWYLTTVEDRFLNTLLLLFPIVVKQTESITAQKHNGRKVTSRQEGTNSKLAIAPKITITPAERIR